MKKRESKLRFPQLDTILMVEKFIQERDGEFKKRKLWESLPKRMMYQTFCTIFDYLAYSGKISIDSEGKIGWIYNSKLAQEYFNRFDLGIKNEVEIQNSICQQKGKKRVLSASERNS
jgi:hypothetical protein